MAKRKKTYKAQVPVVVNGVQYDSSSDPFDADPAEVAFLVGVGAVKETEKKKD